MKDHYQGRWIDSDRNQYDEYWHQVPGKDIWISQAIQLSDFVGHEMRSKLGYHGGDFALSEK